jgi:predicted lipid-binding transport protein (Tim44 family)
VIAFRAMADVGRRVGLGMVIGLAGGLVVGLLLALGLHKHDYAFWGFLLIPTIFGLIVGAFVGGMSGLDSPSPGQEPADPID